MSDPHHALAYSAMEAGLALIFFDPGEVRFIHSSLELVSALTLVGFTVRRLHAENIVMQIQAEFAPERCSGFARLFVAYVGYGRLGFVPCIAVEGSDSSKPAMYGLCDLNRRVTPVSWLMYATVRAFRSPVRSIVILLDCCFDSANDRVVDVPAEFDRDFPAKSEQLEEAGDCLVLHALGQGLGYAGIGTGYAATLAECIRLYRGVLGCDLLWLHEEAIRRLHASDFYRRHVAPCVAHNSLRRPLYLSEPRFKDHIPAGFYVPFPDLQAALLPGQDPISENGTCKVYAAHWLGKDAVVKVLQYTPSPGQTPDDARDARKCANMAFHAEAELQAGLRCVGVGLTVDAWAASSSNDNESGHCIFALVMPRMLPLPPLDSLTLTQLIVIVRELAGTISTLQRLSLSPLLAPLLQRNILPEHILLDKALSEGGRVHFYLGGFAKTLLRAGVSLPGRGDTDLVALHGTFAATTMLGDTAKSREMENDDARPLAISAWKILLAEIRSRDWHHASATHERWQALAAVPALLALLAPPAGLPTTSSLQPLENVRDACNPANVAQMAAFQFGAVANCTPATHGDRRLVAASTALQVETTTKHCAVNSRADATADAVSSAAACRAMVYATMSPASQKTAIDAGAHATAVAAMRMYAEHADVAHFGCWALSNIAAITLGQQAAIDAGAPAVIVSAMNIHVRVAGIVHYGCRALCNISAIAAGQQAAVIAIAPAAIVSAMIAHIGVAGIAHFGCQALANITSMAAGKQAAIDMRVPAAIVSAINAHMGVTDVALYGCWALSNITDLVVGKQAAIDAGAPAAIVSAMNAHMGVADVAKYGCFALLNIADLDAGKQAAIDAGAPATIVATINAHMGVADVVLYGCWALSNVATIYAGKQAAIDAGAPTAIVSAMKSHLEVAKVAHFGCGALANITFIDAGRQAAIDSSAPAAIVSAMNAHVRITDVALYGCLALSDITDIDAGRQAVLDTGAPVAIVSAMNSHFGVVEVALYGCQALINIAFTSTGEKAVVDAGAPTAIVAAMNAHLGVTEVACHGCHALTNITSMDEGKQAAIDAGAPAAIVSAMNAHMGVTDVALYGCWALSNIAVIHVGKKAAIDSGVPATVVSAMKTHRGVAEVALYGCWALSRITELVAGNQAAIDAGAPAAIVSALNAHRVNTDVALYGCWGLAKIATISAGAQAAVDAGAPAAIVSAMNTHVGVTNVAHYGCRALANIDAGKHAAVDL